MTMPVRVRSIAARATVLGAASFLLLACAARTAEINVASSGGLAAAFQELGPQYERSTGNKLKLTRGPSMGNTPNAIPARLQRGEAIDVVVVVGSALDDFIKKGKVIADSRVDVARSGIGMVVRKGAPKPDISTAEAVKQTLLDAKSIAYSDSASGVYISTQMFQRLGIAEEVKDKSRMIPAEPVAEVVARGEAEVGFQQISELLPVPGVELVGPLPAELQKITVYSAGVVAGSRFPDAARALIRFLDSPDARPAITRSGLDPIVAEERR